MSSLVLTPILVMAFNRPDTLQQQLSRIDQLEKRSVYLSIDGLPEMYTGDRREAWLRCVSVARLWSGTTHHNPILKIQPSNLGLYDHFQRAFTEFFNQFPVGIVLEDDLIFVEEFIHFVDAHQDLLLDGHYWSIQGNNPLPGHDLVSAPSEVEISFRETHIHTISGWASSSKNVQLFVAFCDAKSSWAEVVQIISGFSRKVTRDPALRLGIHATWLRKMRRARAKEIGGSWDNTWELAGWSSGLPSLIPSYSLSRESSNQDEGQSNPHDVTGKPWDSDSLPAQISIKNYIRPFSRKEDIELINIWGIRRAYCWLFYIRLWKQIRGFTYRMNNSIIKMSGGLGNQLFQFALKRSIEYSTRSSTKLDLAWYRYSATEYKRDPEILRFLGSKSDFIDSTNCLVSVSGLLKSDRFRYVYKKFVEAFLLNSRRKQNLEVKYENELDRILDFVNSYSIGSFIGFQFWSDYSDAILAEIRQSLSRIDSRGRTFSPSTIVIHARRGDYYSVPKTRNFHGYCGLDHFAEGVSIINDSYHWDSALIHSDSPEFARELQAFLMSEYAKPASIATDGDPLNILLDFMSANLFVGSNSTLSWWGNALGRHQSSVFPKSWFANENMNGYGKDYFLNEVLFTNCPLLVQGD